MFLDKLVYIPLTRLAWVARGDEGDVLICLFLAIYWIAPSWFGVPPITLVAPRNPGKAGEGNINQFIGLSVSTAISHLNQPSRAKLTWATTNLA
jgi:hypothetical protein